MNHLPAVLLGLLIVSCCFGQAPSSTTSSGATIVAKVLEKDVAAKDPDRLSAIIFGTLLGRYAAEHGIVPTEAELDVFLVASKEAEQQHLADLEARQAALTQELQSTSLTEHQRQTKEARLQTVATSLRALKPFMEQKARTRNARVP